jgi:hypothetical protein
VVEVPAAVVADRRLDRVGKRRDASADLVDRERGEFRARLERLVEVRDVRLMMLGAMDLHRAGVDHRLEGVVGVGQVGQGEGHGRSPRSRRGRSDSNRLRGREPRGVPRRRGPRSVTLRVGSIRDGAGCTARMLPRWTGSPA